MYLKCLEFLVVSDVECWRLGMVEMYVEYLGCVPEVWRKITSVGVHMNSYIFATSEGVVQDASP